MTRKNSEASTVLLIDFGSCDTDLGTSEWIKQKTATKTLKNMLSNNHHQKPWPQKKQRKLIFLNYNKKREKFGSWPSSFPTGPTQNGSRFSITHPPPDSQSESSQWASPRGRDKEQQKSESLGFFEAWMFLINECRKMSLMTHQRFFLPYFCETEKME